MEARWKSNIELLHDRDNNAERKAGCGAGILGKFCKLAQQFGFMPMRMSDPAEFSDSTNEFGSLGGRHSQQKVEQSQLPATVRNCPTKASFYSYPTRQGREGSVLSL